MNNNIKFRVWDKESKEMFYQNDKCFIFDSLCGKFSLDYEFGEILERSRFIVEQFTGLKDKNGKEIYNGDIIQSVFRGYDLKIKLTGKVQFIDSGFWFKALIGKCLNKKYDIFKGKRTPVCLGIYDSFPSIYELKGLKKLEIIGNIHENPEILAECLKT